MEIPHPTATFIVRVSRGAAGEIVGSVLRVRTGERRPFHRADAIGRLITEMILAVGTADEAGRRPDEPTQEVSP